MKILLICLPRSGSTSLFNSLGKLYKLQKISIPDVYRYPRDINLIRYCERAENIIFRMSPSHNIGDSLTNLSGKFTHTLLLSRKNETEHLESLVNLYYRETVSLFGFHSTYDLSDIPAEFKTLFCSSEDWRRIKADRKSIEELATILKTPVLYYEDLFYPPFNYESIKSMGIGLDIELLKKELSKTTKLRIYSKKVLF